MIDDNDTPTPPPAPEGRILYEKAHLKHEVNGGVKAKTKHYDKHDRPQQVPGGRPPALDARTKQKMQDGLRTLALGWKRDHGELPSAQTMMQAARMLAAQADMAHLSDDTLSRHVTGPITQELSAK
jgi:hypothetical protein